MNTEIRLALLRTLPFLIVLIVFAVLMRRRKIKSKELDVRAPFSWKLYFLLTFGFLCYVLLSELTLDSFNILEVIKWHHDFAPSTILIFGAVVLAPIAEELIFRGLLINVAIKKGLSDHWAILAQAVFFVLLHNFAYENTLSSNIGIVQSFIDAILFGYARKMTKSIYTPMTMHITGNVIATLERFIL